MKKILLILLLSATCIYADWPDWSARDYLYKYHWTTYLRNTNDTFVTLHGTSIYARHYGLSDSSIYSGHTDTLGVNPWTSYLRSNTADSFTVLTGTTLITDSIYVKAIIIGDSVSYKTRQKFIRNDTLFEIVNVDTFYMLRK